MGHAIEVIGLRKRFGEVTALAGIDMVVEEGEVHGLLGPNGAGKSTLLRILFGLVQADQGEAKIFGREHLIDGPGAVSYTHLGSSGAGLSTLLESRTDWSNALLEGVTNLAGGKTASYDIKTYYLSLIHISKGNLATARTRRARGT